MITLTLKDPNQCRINSGANVVIKGRMVCFHNVGIQMEYLIIAGVIAGSYWIDRESRSVQLILYNGIGVPFTYEIVIGDMFFELFPDARDWWGEYFFRLHYAG